MRWSTRFVLAGILVIGFGCIPLVLGHFNFFALEYASTLITIGLLILLIGLGLRRLTKSFEQVPPP